MLIHQRHTGTRLAQGFPFLIRLQQGVRETFLLRNGLLILHAIFKMFDVFAGMPRLQHLMPFGHKFVMG